MICSTCKNNNEKSKVYIVGTFYDLKEPQDRFFDENGKWHVHDTNPTINKYQCTNGHEWSEKKYAKCWCEN